MRRTLTALATTAALIVGGVGAASADGPRPHQGPGLDAAAEAELTGYARDTWRSFTAMVDPHTGLPADSIGADLSAGSRTNYTSPTNIGVYLWAILGARDLGLIADVQAEARFARVMRALERMERHEGSGQFYNWYDTRTLQTLRTWPEEPHHPVYPFASSVDNGWLATALLMVGESSRSYGARAQTLAESMDFGCYYDPAALGPDAGAGLIRGGFWPLGDEPPDGADYPRGDYCDMGSDVVYTGHHYGSFNSESRIGSYAGIAMGQIPPEHYYAAWRTHPDTCDWNWQASQPVGYWEEHLGVDVFQGAYLYGDTRVVPSWGGSMFEALMVPLVVPEDEWGPTSWAVNHPRYAQAQIDYGLDEAGYGYWGFSPASEPHGGYSEYGVSAIGMAEDGYPSDVEGNAVAVGAWDDPACPRESAPITDYGQGVVTPHAAFLALEYGPEQTMANLRALTQDFDIYGPGGFRDSVNLSTGEVSDRYLALDQGMVFASLVNALDDDGLRAYFAPYAQETLRPLMAAETFNLGN